nr:MAG TPA: hypothetical protein [Caudoviricetes sp.]
MNLSRENIDKLIFGGIYKIDYDDLKQWCPNQVERLNNQHYGIWIPVHSINKKGEENYYMIDTYQMSSNSFNNQYNSNKYERYKALLEGLERCLDGEHGNWVAFKTHDYFYSAIIKITDTNFHIFKLIADLHNYKLSDDDECRQYNKEDVLYHIKLYNEHNYPSGIVLVKKEAKINYQNKINAKIQDIKRWIEQPKAANDYNIQELLKIEKEAIDNNVKYDKQELYKFIKYNDFIKDLETLLKKYLNKNG